MLLTFQFSGPACNALPADVIVRYELVQKNCIFYEHF